MHQGDPDSALADYSKAIELNPRGFLGFYNRSFARKQKGDLDGAIGDLNEALEINPADVDAWFERGILRGARSDLDGALADLCKSIELNPRNARAYANRGMIMLLRRQDLAAREQFNAALKIDSSLRSDLEKSIDQIIKARESQPAAVRRP
jgi:tetratricopeptide (TPR) repeat protein